MTNKTIISITLITLISIFSITNLFGQSFSHSGGASIFSLTEADFGIGGSVAVPSGTYSPRFNFYESRGDFTLSVGSHLSLGGQWNSRTGGYFIVNAPLVLEANFGHAAHPDTRSGFGGFIGGGFSYTNLSGYSAYGPMANAGLRFIIMDRPITLRGSYLISSLGDSPDISNIISLGLFYNIGDY